MADLMKTDFPGIKTKPDNYFIDFMRDAPEVGVLTLSDVNMLTC